jgi:hypothetical protein
MSLTNALSHPFHHHRVVRYSANICPVRPPKRLERHYCWTAITTAAAAAVTSAATSTAVGVGATTSLALGKRRAQRRRLRAVLEHLFVGHERDVVQ